MPQSNCEQSDYKLCFKLKQHTPLIHFQADQKGATLRATELKPKLDRFLLTKLGDGDYEEGIEIAKQKKWLIGKGEHPALDYKVRIEPKGDAKYYLPLAFIKNSQKNNLVQAIQNNEGIDCKILAPCLFFANADKIKFQDNRLDLIQSKLNELIYAVMFKKGIKLYITTFHTELKDKIETTIHSFFAKENFGMRQNKGFGCFEAVEPTLSKSYEELIKENYKYVYRFDGANDFSKIFTTIKDVYSELKSGINYPQYKKSQLFKYFVTRENPIRWEKRKIKQAINSHLYEANRGICFLKANKVNNRYNPPIYDAEGNQNWRDIPQEFNYAFIRTLLGFTDKFEFLTNKNCDGKYIVKVSNNDIARYQSPITFKVHNNHIYLCANRVDISVFENKNFNFEFYFNDIRLTDINMEPLQVPTNFDIENFLDFALIANSENNEIITGWSKIKGSNHEQ